MSGLTHKAIAELPASARIRHVQEVMTKERAMRLRVLKGADRDRKVAEADVCFEYLRHIDRALETAKGIVAAHKEMCARLRICAERHGLAIGDGHVDQIIIAEIERRKGAA